MRAPPRAVIVVGAGAFGASSALELRRRGHEVRLLDPGPLPNPRAASTDISKMVRMDYGHDEFYMAFAERAMEIWEAWGRSQPDDPVFHPDGFLLLARTALGAGQFEGDSFRLLEARGHHPERIDADRLARRFPVWRQGPYVDGYFNPRAGWAEAARTVTRILRQAAAAGVRLDEGQTVRELLVKGSRVAGVRTARGDRLPASTVVVAAGAWTPVLLPWLSDRMWPSAQPVLHLSVDDPGRFQPPRFPPWAADLSRTGWYGFPALPDGTVKVANHGPGLRVDPDGGRDVPPGTEELFREFLVASLPELADAPLGHSRLCLYCDTFDADFWIDRDPDREGLVVAAGGSGHGFKFVPLIGQIVADRVDGLENPWAHRFRWRSVGERRTEAARFTG